MGQLRINKFRKHFKEKGVSVEEQLQKIQSETLLKPANSSGVYIIHSKANDFIYIGSAAITFSIRWKDHISDLKMLRHSNGLLQFLYCKYGLNNLGFYVLENCSQKECLKRESYHVHKIIPELNLNALLGTTGFDLKYRQELDNWYKTKEGSQYKRKTLTAKREKWIKTKVGRECAQHDIRNLRERLNQSDKSIDEKTNEILEYCREYFPDLCLPYETLIGFINEGVRFKPIWKRSGKTKKDNFSS